MITAHSGDHWACGGMNAPGGEGFTGRGGKSNFRLWVKQAEPSDSELPVDQPEGE